MVKCSKKGLLHVSRSNTDECLGLPFTRNNLAVWLKLGFTIVFCFDNIVKKFFRSEPIRGDLQFANANAKRESTK